MEANIGDILSFNYFGLKKNRILIEDVTKILNLKMTAENRNPQQKVDKILKLGGSTIGSKFADFKMIQIDVSKLNKNATTITAAILDKVPVFFARLNNFNETILYLKGRELNGPVTWNIDGVLFDIPIPIYIPEIKDIVIINNKIIGCIIKVNTRINYKTFKDFNFNNYYFTNKEYYNDDAVLYHNNENKTPSYLNQYHKRSSSEEALKTYISQYSKNKNRTNYHFNILNYFRNKYENSDHWMKILSDYESYSENNAADLKGIAYRYQELDASKKAIAIYKKIVKLRPLYRQSYRDLANSFLEIKEYKKAWQVYHFYLKKNFKIEDNDIGEIISSEIMAAYNIGEPIDTFQQKININNPTKKIKSDVRVVFEWNTSEAEFILEFVNPSLQVYKIENSAGYNNALILDQKKKGYTSKEIFIDHLKRGDWLINCIYLGNKQLKPTIFKVTSYYNWGSPNQSKKINVFELTKENIKIQLLELNSRSL
jgi:hypothetical protein